MKIDWCFEGWRVFPDSQDFTKPPFVPQRIIAHDIRVHEAVLQLGSGPTKNKGWVYVPNEIELEVVSA